MIFTGDQIVAHLVGDYILQSHWMAQNKTKSSWAALVHAVTYTLPFLLITQSVLALAIICGTHFLIDRFRLARYVVWLKNGPVEWGREWRTVRIVGPHHVTDEMWVIKGWKPVTATGYPDDVPSWLAVWLLIFADNTLHLICNGLAIWWFG